jgi:hypothetical protein
VQWPGCCSLVKGSCSCRAWPVEALHATADGLPRGRVAVDEQALLQSGSSLLSVKQVQEGFFYSR